MKLLALFYFISPKRLLPFLPDFFVQLFAAPYVAGDSIATALAVSSALSTQHIASTLDLLAENIQTKAQVNRNTATYLTLIEHLSHLQLPPSISIKLSGHTLFPLDNGGDGAGCREAVREIIEAGKQHGIAITIDMESHHWTDFTLQFFHQLHVDGMHHVGCVLQSRLLRTPNDIHRLPKGCRVRLVLGIYDEPPEIALQNKKEIKIAMLKQAQQLLEQGHYLEFATHDEKLIQQFMTTLVQPQNIAKNRFEIQLLYGVPRDSLVTKLLQSGYTVRFYLPFAIGWPMALAYLRRRLEEYPMMIWLVLKNLLRHAWR